ncbi:MAG: ABC transporter permease [Deltaproteobacteria bacterium]|nr:ABC transporter permease [Deltaproteobacteria bacterium]
MLSLLGWVTWRHFRRHRLRTFLTFFGIVLGVAVIVAIAVVNRTLMSSFQQTIDRVAGKAMLQVTNGESGFEENVFMVVRDTEGVKDASPAVESFFPVVGSKGERLYVYGVDFLGDSSIREHDFSGPPLGLEGALDFIARQDSIAVTETFANRLELRAGSRITLATSRGLQTFTVRALLKEQGAAKVFGGSFALMDLPVAQFASGKEGKIDVVDLTVEDGETIEAVQKRLQARLQGSAQVDRPRKRGEQIESLLTSYRVGLFFVSLVALFVGFFLIYNTVSVSVVQRKKEIGSLRCLGLLRRHVLILFVLEAVLLGFFGSLAGFLLGFLLAQGALLSVGESVSYLFLPIDMAETQLTAKELWIALACGLGVSLVAGVHPAWQAMRVSPLENTRQALWSPDSRGVSQAYIAGFILFFLSALLLITPAPYLAPVQRFS